MCLRPKHIPWIHFISIKMRFGNTGKNTLSGNQRKTHGPCFWGAHLCVFSRHRLCSLSAFLPHKIHFLTLFSIPNTPNSTQIIIPMLSNQLYIKLALTKSILPIFIINYLNFNYSKLITLKIAFYHVNSTPKHSNNNSNSSSNWTQQYSSIQILTHQSTI
jgi:hypothetical protein